MKHVSPRAAALTVVCAVALMLFSAVSAQAASAAPGNHLGSGDNPGNHWGKDNNPGNHYGQLSNPGHHYGWYKHPQTPPPVTPPLVTPPVNTTPPITHPGQSGGSGGPDVLSQGLGAGSGTGEAPGFGFPPITVLGPSNQIKLTSSAPSDPWGWAVLLILPALAAVWLLVLARAALSAARRRRTARA